MDSIPKDLILEIFCRFSPKSIARCRSVSKLWGSILSSPYFTKLFSTRSSARPRLLFAVRRFPNEWQFYSSHQPQNLYKKSSMVVAADYHIKFPQDMKLRFFGCAFGLIYFRLDTSVGNNISKDALHVICNPSTGERAFLPKVSTSRASSLSLLGFDPVDKIFKLLFITYWDQKILTLGTGELSWRNIQCPQEHHPFHEEGAGICINGVLFYYAAERDGERMIMIVCFDVRSEKFKFIDGELVVDDCHRLSRLTNYKGKLGLVSWNDDHTELCMRVLEDVEKQEWSNYVCSFPKDQLFDPRMLSVAGVTATGEIVLSRPYTFKSFYVFYFNPERNTLRGVEIQGCGDSLGAFTVEPLLTFVDHVEDLNVLNDTMYLKSSISASSIKNKGSPTIITRRLKPQDQDETIEKDMDSRYDDGVSREKKHMRNEGDSSEDEERRRRRRHQVMRDRERCVESGRDDRDDLWSDKGY